MNEIRPVFRHHKAIFEAGRKQAIEQIIEVYRQGHTASVVGLPNGSGDNGRAVITEKWRRMTGKRESFFREKEVKNVTQQLRDVGKYFYEAANDKYQKMFH